MTAVAIGSPRIEAMSPYLALAGNAFAGGLAAAYVFNPLVGVCVSVTHIALAHLNDLSSQRFWFPVSEETAKQLKQQWEESPPLFQVQIVMGVVLRSLKVSVNQVAMNWLKSSLTSPSKAFYAISKICIVAPLIEETLFRGFLQEKIRDVQVFLLGKQAADGSLHTIVRIALQAIVFGFCHYHASQGAFNLMIICATTAIGIIAGLVKESVQHLWSSSFLHAHMNSALTMRVCIFKV